MAHMHLETVRGLWYLVEGRQGTDVIPADVCGVLGRLSPGGIVDRDWAGDSDGNTFESFVDQVKDYCTNSPGDIEGIECFEGWGCRYSAPGYMDCTDWVLGDTEEEAKRDCLSIYGDDSQDEEEDCE